MTSLRFVDSETGRNINWWWWCGGFWTPGIFFQWLYTFYVLYLPQKELGSIHVHFESSFLLSWCYFRQYLKYFDKIIFNACMIFFTVSKWNIQIFYSVWFQNFLQHQRFKWWSEERECIILRDLGVGTLFGNMCKCPIIKRIKKDTTNKGNKILSNYVQERLKVKTLNWNLHFYFTHISSI